jgi:hypothetical protein
MTDFEKLKALLAEALADPRTDDQLVDDLVNQLMRHPDNPDNKK